ncbi:TKL protein kinase [Salpingoeca rosetta]|uniref:TKL protein kinase n=1 Tax=Salpingoeca rosetta (strain ATCC 50818 / BSB-021) TaxID=946362 RepID=F2TXQ5_SALR5|nr:TKL protein kinase [Salpingoeca rosetta]EGD76164.1 TKL protein kinase [Salpingoeca rosetta]|eukprot:XP_004998339.1 TKL protein kinase [Salpingoeca rosetta]
MAVDTPVPLKPATQRRTATATTAMGIAAAVVAVLGIAISVVPCELAHARVIIPYNAPELVTSKTATPPSLAWHTTTLLALESDFISVTVGGGNANDIANNRATIRLSDDIWVFSRKLNLWSVCEIYSGAANASDPRFRTRMHHAAERITPLSVYNTSSPARRPLREGAGKLMVLGGAVYIDNNVTILDDHWMLEVWRSPIETQSFFTCAWTRLEKPAAMAPRFLPAVSAAYHPFELYSFGGCLEARRRHIDVGDTTEIFLECTDTTNEVWRYTEDLGWSLLAQAVPADSASLLRPLLSSLMYRVGGRVPRTYMIYGGFPGRASPYVANVSMCTFPDPHAATGSTTFSCQALGSACVFNQYRECKDEVRFVSRGAVIPLGNNRTVLFGVPDGISDSLVGFLHEYSTDEPAPRFTEIRSLSRLLTPVFSGASSRIGLLGGFSATPLAAGIDVEQFLFFGDFFRPQTGDAWSTWLYTPQSLTAHSHAPVLSGVWQDKFFYSSMTARAWPSSQTVGHWVIQLGGYTGSVANSDWKFDVGGVLEAERKEREKQQQEEDKAKGESMEDDDDHDHDDDDEEEPVNPEDVVVFDEENVDAEALTVWVRLDELDQHTSPFSRFYGSSATVNDSAMFVFGGQRKPRSGCANDAFFFFPETHRVVVQEGGPRPAERRGSTLVRMGSSIYLYGGEDCDNEFFLDDLWRFDLHLMRWFQLSRAATAPIASSYHTAAALKTSENVTEMAVFGGFRPRNEYDHFGWAFNPQTQAWRPIESDEEPLWRTSHCAVRMDEGPIAGQLVMIGGASRLGVDLGDGWLYHHASQRWQRLRDNHVRFSLSPGRLGHTCSAFRDTVFVFGGTSRQRFFRSVIAFRPTCNPGFSADNGQCVPCPLRTYRSDLSNPSCVQCSGDLTTKTEGATDVSLCNICRDSACVHGTGTAVASDCICRCSFGYSGKACDINVLGIVLGTLFALAVIGFATWHVLRFYRRVATSIKQHSALQQRLLDEKEQEIELFEQIWTISPDELQFVRVLDEGAFGRVELMVWLSAGLNVAVKRLREAILQLDDTCKQDFEREVKFVRQLRHPNIVRFHGAYLGAQPFLVMEYVERGSLQTILADNAVPISDARKHSFLCDTAAGMHYLHQKGRMHRDLKSANLLVTMDWRIKVTDFTTAKNVVQDALTRQRRASQVSAGMAHARNATMSALGRQHVEGTRGGGQGGCSWLDADKKASTMGKVCGGLERTACKFTRGMRRRGQAKSMSVLPRSDGGDKFDFDELPVSLQAQAQHERRDTGQQLLVADLDDGDGNDETTTDSGGGLEGAMLLTTDSDDEDAVVIGERPSPAATQRNEADYANIWNQTTGIGTIPWTAPEALADKAYGLPADVYSYGIVISEITTRRLPYWDYKGSIRKGVLAGLRPTMPEDCCDRRYIDLAAQCWCENPQERLTFSQIVTTLQSFDGESSL